MVKSKLFSAVAVLVGTTVGAGFLGIPYVISKTGAIPGIAILIAIAALMFLVKLYLGEVILRTNGNHQLAGYAERYLGKTGKFLMFLAMFFGIYSALVAYLIAEGQSLSFIIFGFDKYAFVLSLLFWAIMSGFTYVGLSALKKYERIAMIVVLSLVALIAIVFLKNISLANLSYINSSNIFLPFGVILFSFLAFSAMPEVKRVLSGQEKLMKKTIFLGIAIPFIIYVVFSLIVVGVFGRNVPEVATLALGRGFSVLGVITMFTAFFSGSIAIRDMFRFDFKFGRFIGWILCSLIPLALFLTVYFLKFASFIQILSVAGIISGGLTGILVLLMNKKAKKTGNRRPEYQIHLSWWVIALISVIFILAVLAEFLF